MPLPCPLHDASMHRESLSNRQAALILGLQRYKNLSENAKDQALAQQLYNTFTSAEKHWRTHLVSSPQLHIWLRLQHNGQQHAQSLNDLSRLFDNADTAYAYTLKNGIGCARDEVDPLIKHMSPPTYTFTDAPMDNRYDIALFGKVADAACYRISQVWPSVGALLPEYIKLFIHIPETNFRSCSASRYAGVVFCSSCDESIIELEESIVHEYCHQVLYERMEMAPHLLKEDDEQFLLPWSQTTRDFYGFFHAYAVYAYLAYYFKGVMDSHEHTSHFPEDVEYARNRYAAIMEGLLIAREQSIKPMHHAFTQTGLAALATLEVIIDDLVDDARAGASLEKTA